MAGLKQSKRVSWAPDVKLCQVRLFLSEDTPSQSGSAAQDHLQAKTLWLQHPRELNSEESLPPGFESLLPPCQSKGISHIPVINWRAPNKLFMKQEWLVVAGDESKEVELENQRQLGVFEAIYPRPSSIPPNPVFSELQDSCYDDTQTPLVPVIPIEDDLPDELDPLAAFDPSILVQHAETAVETGNSSLNLTTDGSVSNMASCAPDMHNSDIPEATSSQTAKPDVVAAASAAFTALVRSSEEGSLVDRDLLIKILNNPSLMEKLIAGYGSPGQQPSSFASIPPAPPPQSNTSAPMTVPQIGEVLPRPKNSTNELHAVAGIQIPANPSVGGPPLKGASYFNNLHPQHEARDPHHTPFDSHRNYTFKAVAENSTEQGSMVSRDVKQKIPKPCMYFNSPRGCRRGAECSYVHDASLPRTMERQGRKKIKLDREVSRRM